jgi:hypothetical protein
MSDILKQQSAAGNKARINYQCRRQLVSYRGRNAALVIYQTQEKISLLVLVPSTRWAPITEEDEGPFR